MMHHYPDIGSASDWSCSVENLFQPIRSTTTGKTNRFPFLDILGYLKKLYPQKSQIWKSETSPNQGTWLGIPWLGLVSLCQMWDFYGYSLNTLKYPNMGIHYFFLCTQIWVVMRHQYGISALVSPISFGGETSGSVTKCWLFSQAIYYFHFLFYDFIFSLSCSVLCATVPRL